MDRLNSVGIVVAIALSLMAFATPASAQQSPRTGPPEGAVPSTAGAPRAVAAKPPAGRPFRPAYLLTTVNLRSGPGANYDLVQVVPEGSTVGVAKCSAGWCAAVWKGRRGFAPVGALSIAQAGPDGIYPPYDDELTPAYHGGPGDDGSAPTISFGAGFDVGFGYGPHSRWHRRW